jgi:hypothetical protein
LADDFIGDLQHRSVVGVDCKVGWGTPLERLCKFEGPNLVPSAFRTHLASAHSIDQHLIARPQLADHRPGAWDCVLNVLKFAARLDDAGDDQIA